LTREQVHVVLDENAGNGKVLAVGDAISIGDRSRCRLTHSRAVQVRLLERWIVIDEDHRVIDGHQGGNLWWERGCLKFVQGESSSDPVCIGNGLYLPRSASENRI
jgi:hypothetical protein